MLYCVFAHHRMHSYALVDHAMNILPSKANALFHMDDMFSITISDYSSDYSSDNSSDLPSTLEFTNGCDESSPSGRRMPPATVWNRTTARYIHTTTIIGSTTIPHYPTTTDCSTIGTK